MLDELKQWPRNTQGAYVCNKDNPMPLHLAKGNGRWEHDDVHETNYDGEYSIEYKCHSCGHVWRSEMPE